MRLKELLTLCLIIPGLGFGCAPNADDQRSKQVVETSETNHAKIIGGFDVAVAKEDDWARSVVGVWIGGEKLEMICTATLISDQLALTAAHCLDQAKQESLEVHVVFSENIFSHTQDQKRKVQNHVIHPNYFLSTAKYADIALIQFSGGIPSGFQPVAVLPKKISQSLLQPGQEVLMAGMGVNFFKSDKDSGGEGYLRGAVMPIGHTTDDSDRVLFENKNGKCTSPGDSGGPGFVMWNGRWHLWGVISWGDSSSILESGCARLTGTVKIPHFERWLKRSAKELDPSISFPEAS